VPSSPETRDRLFRQLADTLPLLVWIAGTDNRSTYFNKPWLEFTGRSLEQEIGDGWFEGVHTADRQQCLDTYLHAFEHREPVIMEYRHRRHDGQYRWILDHAKPLFDAGGSFAGYIGTCFDVTEFRRAEAERNRASERLRLAMEAGKSVGWERDLETKRSTWSGDLPTVFGIPSNTHVGDLDELRRWMHPEDQARVWKAAEEALEKHSPYEAEFRIVWPDGTLRWLSARGQYYYSPEGKPERMLGIAVDITDRKEAEASLQRKERELEEAQRLAGVGSWQWDRQTGTVVWSEELYRIAGRDPVLPAVSYEQHPQLYPGESWERLRGAVETALETGAPYELVLKMARDDGTQRWVTARGEVQRDSTGSVAGLRGTVQDITERKLAEEALSTVNGRLIEAQEAERARIARDLHDDIGQRLAMLAMAAAQLKGLLTDSAGAEARRCLEALQKQTAEIIGDLGFMPAMRGFCEELARQKGAEITFRCENVPGSPPADVSLCLFRVLQEALHNALRHSGARHFDVHLRADGNTIDLAVRDAGAGFDLHTVDQRVGLGLTSMNERLRLVGGELLIESQPARGTTILARAPLRPSS
jgi:PAS domain S-box-containing protein